MNQYTTFWDVLADLTYLLEHLLLVEGVFLFRQAFSFNLLRKGVMLLIQNFDFS